MRFWPKGSGLLESVYRSEEKLADDFTLLAYSNSSGRREMDLVGTNSARDTIIVLSRDGGREYLEIDRFHVEGQVYTLIPHDFDSDGKVEYLVMSKDGEEGYRCVLYGGKERAGMSLGRSDSMPFIFTYFGDLTPSVFVQKSGETKIFSYTGRGFTSVRPLEQFRPLSKYHSSGFVDISGDGIADLVLVTAQEGREYMEWWRNTDGGFKEEGRMVLPSGAGPLIFADFSGSGAVDIAFLSEEDEETYLNVLYNTRKPFCSKEITKNCLKERMIMTHTGDHGFTTERGHFRKFSIGEMAGGMKAVMATELYAGEHIPLFPNVSDFNGDSYPDILLLLTDGKKTVPAILVNEGGQGFSRSKDLREVDLTSPISASFFDSGSCGKPDLVVNVREGGTNSLRVFRNSGSSSNYHLTLTTTHPKMGRHSYSGTVLGSMYAYSIVEDKRIRMGMHPPQSGFSPLQSPVVTIGLGNTNVFVTSVYVGIPSIGGPYPSTSVFSGKVVPNSDLVMQPAPGKINMSLYLNLDEYSTLTIPIFGAVLLINILIVFYFTMQEKRQDRRDRKKNRFRVDFDAL
jgi:hypothetical protein